MFKPITRIASAALLTVAASAVTAGAAEARCLYLNGSDNTWLPPTTEYQEYFDAHSLTETAEGSNVFTGEVSFSSRYFRMHYALATPDEGGSYSYSWLGNVVVPALDYSKVQGEGVEALAELGRSGVVTASAKKFIEAPVTSNWTLADGQFGRYSVIVDLNKGSLTMIPDSTCVVVFGNDPTPTVATAGNYVKARNYMAYHPAGNLSFRLYDLAQQKWANPTVSQDYPQAQTTWFNFEYSSEKGEAITVADWQGGVLKLDQGTAYGYVQPLPDKPVFRGETATELYLPGDYTTPVWDFSASDVHFYTSDTPVARFEIEVPAGALNWKITLGPSWERNFGPSAVVKEADGTLTAYLEAQGVNFEMTEAMTAPVKAVVDLEKMTVTFPAGTPVKTFGNKPYESDGTYPSGVDELLLVGRDASIIPWEGASAAVMDQCIHLNRQEDGTYTFSGYVDPTDFVLITKRAAKGESPRVFAPKEGSDRELVLVNGEGFSSAVGTTLDKAGYWTVPEEARSRWTNLTVTASGDGGARMTFFVPTLRAEEGDSIFMMGSPTGWDITASDVVLKATTDGGYYGSAEVEAGSGYSAPTFRFYSKLGSWDEYSIGSQADDMAIEIDMDGGLYEGSCVPGKGSWTLNGWEGGTLYMYVNTERGQVRFSAVPMDYTLGTNTQGKQKFYLFGSDRQGGGELNRGANGIFTADMSLIASAEVGTESYYIFKEKPNMATDDPEWGKKGLIKPAGALEPDRFNVGETTFTDAAEGEMPMLTVDRAKFRGNGNTTAVLTLDANTNKIYFESWGRSFYLTGAIADERELTYDNRESWADFFMPGPGPKEIPAGKFDMTLRRSIHHNGAIANEEKVVFGEDKVSISGNRIYGYMDSHVTCDGWQGGLVMISPVSMMDITDLEEISAVTYGADNKPVHSLLKREAGSHVYTGSVKMVPSSAAPTMSFLLNRDDSYEREFFVGSPRYYGYFESVADRRQWLMPEGNAYASALGVNSSAFIFPAFTGEGELEVKLDLEAMTMSATVADENNRPLYEAVADENSPLDGVLVMPSSAAEDAMIAAATVEDDGEFNFTRLDGTTVAPAAGEEEIVFGADGTWEGNAVVSDAPASTRMKARAAAMEAGKWKFSLPEGVESTEISMLLDEKAGKLKVFSSAHNTDVFYIITTRDGNYDVQPVIEHFDLLKQNVLRRNASGIFEGDIAVEDSETFDVAFYSTLVSTSGYYRVSSFGKGISTAGTPSHLFDFAAEDSETLVKGASANRSADNWRIVAPGKTVHISFDPQAYELTMTVPTGVDNVSVDRAGAISVVPGTGVLRVTAPEGGHIDVYSVSGMLVRSTDLVPGTTEIELPAGVYLAAGRKFFVR